MANDLIFQIIIPVVTTVAGYFLGRNKEKAEVKRIEVETKKEIVEIEQKENNLQKDKIDLARKTIEFYEEQYIKLIDKIQLLEEKIKTLEDALEAMSIYQCNIENCPGRNQFIGSKPIKKK